MISPIYALRPRGEVVTSACQWLWQERRIVFHLILLPIIITLVLLLLIHLTGDSEMLYFIVGLVDVLLLPVLPNMLFLVVENPDEYGYNARHPRYIALAKKWPRMFLDVIIIVLVQFVLGILSVITVLGPLAVSLLSPLMLVIIQREKGVGLSFLSMSVKMAFGSFMNFIICVMGVFIIGASLIGTPILLLQGLRELMSTYLSSLLYDRVMSILGQNFFESATIVILFLTFALAYIITMVIGHFFYGHCTEKRSHPGLIFRMENNE